MPRRLRAYAEFEGRDGRRRLHRHTGAHALMRRANSVRGDLSLLSIAEMLRQFGKLPRGGYG